jgi:hypothetical protein
MESVGYKTILERNLLPFVKKVFPYGHRLWQDNDPKRTSKATKKWMKDNKINHWPTPPESPVSTKFYCIMLVSNLIPQACDPREGTQGSI